MNSKTNRYIVKSSRRLAPNRWETFEGYAGSPPGIFSTSWNVHKIRSHVHHTPVTGERKG